MSLKVVHAVELPVSDCIFYIHTHIFRVSCAVPLYCIPVYSSILIRENGGDGECEFGCGDDECLFFRSSGTIYGPTSGRLVHFVEKRLLVV